MDQFIKYVPAVDRILLHAYLELDFKKGGERKIKYSIQLEATASNVYFGFLVFRVQKVRTGAIIYEWTCAVSLD